MFEELYDKFSSLFEALTLDLDKTAFLTAFEKLYSKHREVNHIHNLTRITSVEDFFEKHFIDSLLIGFIEPSLFTAHLNMADVGCGGGFPSLPLALINPRLNIRGIESLGKKVSALNEIAGFCGFKNLQAHKFRAREAGRRQGFAGSFDIVTARAVATADVLIKECRQLLKKKGKMIFYKTPEAVKKESSLAQRESDKYKLSLTISEKYLLSEASGERQFFVLKRES